MATDVIDGMRDGLALIWSYRILALPIAAWAWWLT